MRILVTGAKGQLGWELIQQAPEYAFDCIGIDIDEADLTRPAEVDPMVADILPDLIINAAAYTQVDAAETDTRTAFAVNRDAAAHLAAACARARIPLVHISTDFVFDGRKREPYLETDPVAPLGIYGKSKAAGEKIVRETLDRHLIIRTAWLYGVHGHNFVKSMLHLGRENNTLRVVADQFGCPTFAADLAAALLTISRRLLDAKEIFWGTYHLCGQGAVSWHGFAQHIMAYANRLGMVDNVDVYPITTPEYPTPAPRPAYSVLSCRKMKNRLGISCPPWQISLETMLERVVGAETETD